jgi:hypothetical protein
MTNYIIRPGKVKIIENLCLLTFSLSILYLVFYYNSYNTIDTPMGYLINVICIFVFSCFSIVSILGIIFLRPKFEFADDLFLIKDIFITKKFLISELQISFYTESTFWGYIKFNGKSTKGKNISYIIPTMNMPIKMISELKEIYSKNFSNKKVLE